MSTLDSSWVISTGASALAAHNSPAWRALYLSVCKLLDLALALPAQTLPQFQMYRWAFVSESTTEEVLEKNSQEEANGGAVEAAVAMAKEGLVHPQQDFVPYVVRVARLLLQKVINIEPIT